jgi:hypothetical protein
MAALKKNSHEAVVRERETAVEMDDKDEDYFWEVDARIGL